MLLPIYSPEKNRLNETESVVFKICRFSVFFHEHFFHIIFKLILKSIRVGSHVVFAWIHCTDVRIHCTDILIECR